MTTFVVVDNLRIHREGTRTLIGQVKGAKVVDALDFPEAMARSAWDDVDYVLCDIADEPLSEQVARDTGRIEEQDERHRDWDFMSIDLIEKIKTEHPQTQVVAVTGHSFVFENHILRRMVREAKADHFVYRANLDALLEKVVVTGDDLVQVIDELEPATAADEIPEFGITRRTRVREMVRTMSKEKYREFLRRGKVRHLDDRRSSRLRSEVEGAAGELKGVDAEGKPTGKSARMQQLKKINEMGTRIPDEFRNRGN